MEIARRRKPAAIWPAEFCVDDVDTAIKFVLSTTTWDEPAQAHRPMPDRKYIREYVKLLYENRERKGTIVTEKCRRMVISWVSRAFELWLMGLKRGDGLLVGEDLEAAAKHLWRYTVLYDQLKITFPSWNLPKYEVWKHQGERQLRAFQLANGSRVSYANGEASSVQGDGLAWVTLEEISLYPYASGILAQAKIITQGDGGARGGFIHGIANAKAGNSNWQQIKSNYRQSSPVELMSGVSRRIHNSTWFVEMDWWADETRTEKWLEETRLEMSDVPFEFREQILRQDDVAQGALYTREIFDLSRRRLDQIPSIVLLIVAVDPSVTDPEMRKNPNKKNDECGIVVLAVDSSAQGYILRDASGHYSPDTWAKLSCSILQKYAGELKPLRWLLVAEANQGGELVRSAIKNVWSDAPVELVHASIGKRPRAEPTVQLFEQDRLHIVGHLPELEREAVSWNAHNPSAKSPNRVDAMVWAIHAARMCGSCEVRTHARMSKPGRVQEYAGVR